MFPSSLSSSYSIVIIIFFFLLWCSTLNICEPNVVFYFFFLELFMYTSSYIILQYGIPVAGSSDINWISCFTVLNVTCFFSQSFLLHKSSLRFKTMCQVVKQVNINRHYSSRALRIIFLGSSNYHKASLLDWIKS